MKIIDLLNKIANGEEVPKKIKYDNVIYVYVRMWEQYVNEETEKPLLKEISAYNYSGLNNEVEILDDEEKELPKKINNWISNVGKVDDSNIEEYVHKLYEAQTQLYFKVNSIIDYLEKQR